MVLLLWLSVICVFHVKLLKVVKGDEDHIIWDDSLERGNADITSPRDGENIILWWTPFTGIWGQTRRCNLGACYFTENRSYLNNGWTKVVLFYGSDFNVEDLPLPRRSLQWWGVLHEESPKNQPLFDHQPVLELFNLTSTFRRESDFPLTLQHLESVESLTSSSEFVSTNLKNKYAETENLAPVVYIQSDCDTPSERDKYVEELAKYMKIDSYGACLHNRKLSEHLQGAAENFDHADLRSLIAKYKFSLAIENAACDDYITEKLWRPLTVGSVPLYWGSPSMKDWEPIPKSVIYISDFQSPKDLATYLHKLLRNDTLYESHLRHKIYRRVANKHLLQSLKKRKWGINNDFERGNFIEHFECYVCDETISRQGRTTQNMRELKADLEHYGCPEPPSVLTGKPNHKSHWVEEWHKARVEAKVLNRLIVNSAETFTSDRFFQQVIEELQKDGFFKKYPPPQREEL